MRLVDVDTILDLIKDELKQDRPDDIHIRNIIRVLEDLPSAFDVDAVTEKICKEIRKCNEKLYDNSNTVNVLTICERRQVLREVLRIIDKDVMV